MAAVPRLPNWYTDTPTAENVNVANGAARSALRRGDPLVSGLLKHFHRRAGMGEGNDLYEFGYPQFCDSFAVARKHGLERFDLLELWVSRGHHAELMEGKHDMTKDQWTSAALSHYRGA